MTDILERLQRSVTKGHEPSDEDAIDAAAEIARLQEAKRHFSELANAKGMENVELRVAADAARQAIQYAIDMGTVDPGAVLLQALNKCDAALGRDAEQPALRQENERLREVLQQCAEALQMSYDVCDYPANGKTRQERALESW